MSAVAVEAHACAFWGRYYGLPDPLLQVPNAFFFFHSLNKFQVVLSGLMPLLRYAWAVVGMPVFTVAWAIRWICSSGWTRRASLPDTIYLHASNDRNMAYVPKRHGRPRVAVLLPFRKDRPIGAWIDEEVDLRSVTTRFDVLRSAALALRATIRLLLSSQSQRVLFTYSAPNWFWVNGALERARLKSVWISNHVDRWAVLATSLSDAATTIVQHGQLGQYDVVSGQRVLYQLPWRLANVERVFVTDDRSVEEFKAAVTGEGPKFVRIQPSLKVVPWQGRANQLKILIIGHGFIRRAVHQLLAQLVEAAPCDAFVFAYRPHPTESPLLSIPPAAEDHFVILRPDDTIPAADLIVSYASSFAEEAAAATGAKLLYLDPRDSDSISRVAQEMKAHRDSSPKRCRTASVR